MNPPLTRAPRSKLAKTLATTMLFTWAVGCGQSHSPIDPPIDPPIDAPIDPPTDPPIGPPVAPSSLGLLAVTRTTAEVTFTEVSEDGATERLTSIGLPADEEVYRVSAAPSGNNALLHTGGEDGASWHLVDLLSGRSFELFEAIQRFDGDTPCAGDFRSRVSWTVQGDAVMVNCELYEERAGVHGLQAARVYRVDVSSEVTRWGGNCASSYFGTSDGRIVLIDASSCVESPWVRLIDPNGEEPDEILPMEADLALYHWAPRGYLVSTFRIDPPIEDLRWVSTEGASTTSVRESIPDTFISALSHDGTKLVMLERPSGGATSIVMLDLRDNTTRTVVAACTDVSGVPRQVRWAPDDSAFMATCNEGTFIASVDGSVIQVSHPASAYVPQLSWRPDSDAILRNLDGAFDLLDASTGEARPSPIPPTLDPIAVDWRTPQWTPRCGPSTLCG